jgi:hypothetical protein
MPCQSDEEFTQGPEQPNAVKPHRLLCNAWAGQDSSDAQNSEENDSDAEADDDWGEQQYSPSANPEKRKRVSEIQVWTTVKPWVTGERAQFEDENIKYQLELAVQEIMNESGIVKLPGHKDNKTDLIMFTKN